MDARSSLASLSQVSDAKIKANFNLSNEDLLTLNLPLIDTPQFSFTQSLDFNASYEPTTTPHKPVSFPVVSIISINLKFEV